MSSIEPIWQMWAVFAMIAAAIVLYANERLPLEQVSLGLVVALLVLFQFFPIPSPDGRILDSRALLSGFANPALIAVLCLMVVGQGLIRTGALEEPVLWLSGDGRRPPWLLSIVAVVLVAALSAFLNNTPVVVVFIPVMAALAERLGRSPSGLMMPLSFAAILGGMTTLIGSSTNLLAGGAYAALGQPGPGIFDFVIPGSVLALAGIAYVALLLPRLLPDRASYAEQLVGHGRQYIAQIRVGADSPLLGQQAVAGMFPGLAGMTVRLVQRGDTSHLPPFDDLELEADDIIVVAATRSMLAQALPRLPGLTGDDLPDHGGDPVLAEVMVAPGSRLAGRNLGQIGFHFHTGCVVLGVQRRSRMLRASMDDIRLEPGDVLLVHGPRERVNRLRGSHEVLLMEWSARDVPLRHRAWRALAVFVAVVLLAATGIVPIVVAAAGGALAMLLAGCLNVHQASRAVDRRVVLLVAAALAMGSALEATGGAHYLAGWLVNLLSGYGPAVVLSALFLLIAILTNVLSNNATAVLFTPIAVSTAASLGMPPAPFLYAVIFAANCSFATPMGYQTNLLVMGPGHYRFGDFVRGGAPLILLLWIIFSFFAPWYYGF